MPANQERLALLREVVRSEHPRSQSALRAALAAHGVAVTQATVSRDIKDCHLEKDGQGAYALPEDIHLARLLAELADEVTIAQNLLLLRCKPGSASAVAAALDAAALPELAGTIAGDDTVLMVATDSDKAVRLAARIERIK
ncbi:MAG: ArgR family transcriptional regulator [Coriobacteriales bacterium]|jgi:transcriptional regulator of arginine metabolism|nr:ArgR family transcriptional regulator [Coriobacteriales bacterium]